MPSTQGGRPAKRRRQEGGEHQRHRTRLATVLGTPNVSGVFMSCARGKERKAAMELVDVMDEHCRALYGTGDAPVVDEDDMDALRNGAPPAAAPPPPAADDIEAQIRGELAQLRAPKTRSTRLVSLETDTECLCFIKCAPPVDAGRVIRRVLEDVEKTGESRSRFVQRLAPVNTLCRAETEAIRTAATHVLPRFFTSERPRTYRIEPRIRSHTSLSRDTLIPLIASCIPDNAAHRVDLANAEIVILVEVLKNVCGIGAMEDYERLGKLNVQTLAQRAQNLAPSRVGDGKAKKDEDAAEQEKVTETLTHDVPRAADAEVESAQDP